MLQERLKRAKAYLGVIMIQFGYAGQGILAKTALNQGMNHFTFSVFRNGIAALVFAPFAIFHERYTCNDIIYVFLECLRVPSFCILSCNCNRYIL